MKKIISILNIAAISIMMFTGCYSYKKEYNENEIKLIELANDRLEEIYEVEIDDNKLEYSVAQEVKEDQYINIKADEELPEVVIISAMYSGKPERGNIMGYVVKYNTKTKEVIDSKIEIY